MEDCIIQAVKEFFQCMNPEFDPEMMSCIIRLKGGSELLISVVNGGKYDENFMVEYKEMEE